LRTVGRDGLAQAITNNIEMARLLARLIEAEPSLELVASGPLSIVRFRYVPPALKNEPGLLDRLNRELALEIQRRGKAFFTSTRFQDKEVLRACLVNYMTNEADIYAMFDEILCAGEQTLSQYRERSK
jgi:glutamate/tyrosine decarboxylase-like PLP-dependent enzyme